MEKKEKKVVILGSAGMLGQELARVFQEADYEVAGWDREDLDITNFPNLEEKLQSAAPQVVINAAAYNAVDLCEENDAEYEKALILNRDLPGKLAELSQKLSFVLVQYSSDYVFDGSVNEAGSGCASGACCGGNCHGAGTDMIGYTEDALPNPINRYGETKYLGEEAVRQKGERYYLIRPSKIFGKPASSPGAKRSFFAVMLELGRKKDSVPAVDEEKSCFTYAPDLAEATRALLEDEAPYGIYHLPNSGPATWYDGVVELYRQAGLTTRVEPVPASAFPRPAKRPACSILLNTKRPPLRPYQEALGEFLETML